MIEFIFSNKTDFVIAIVVGIVIGLITEFTPLNGIVNKKRIISYGVLVLIVFLIIFFSKGDDPVTSKKENTETTSTSKEDSGNNKDNTDSNNKPLQEAEARKKQLYDDAEFYEFDGNRKEAIRSYQKIVDEFPSEIKAKRALERLKN